MVLRDTTERPEVLACGVGKLVGHSGERLEEMLDAAIEDKSWFEEVLKTENPLEKVMPGNGLQLLLIVILQLIKKIKYESNFV